MTRSQLIARLDDHGIFYPVSTLDAAHAARTSIWVACANLQLETGDGANIFGHDPTSSIPLSWEGHQVTRARYLSYKALRRWRGNQGVGPCQLTSPSLQDEADRRGGCWRPQVSMTVGFEYLHGLIAQHGSVRLGFQHYNGTGPAAVAYAIKAEQLVEHWKRLLT
jgi:hypothetical protein